MKLSKKIKTLAAVTVLAIGILAAGIAYASPGQYLNMNKPAAAQQLSQNSGPMTQNANPASADNAKAPANQPMVNIIPTAQNSAQMPQVTTSGQMNYSQMNANHQAMTQVHQSTNMGPGAGYSAMNGSMGQGSVNHAQGGMRMGR